MDELVAKVASATGLDPATAREAVTIIIQFLANAAPKDKVDQLAAAIPGTAPIIASAADGPSDVMEAFGALTAAGLDMGEVQSAATAFGEAARAEVGPETFDAIVASIPGLSQFV